MQSGGHNARKKCSNFHGFGTGRFSRDAENGLKMGKNRIFRKKAYFFHKNI
jgi:hypothetical protein